MQHRNEFRIHPFFHPRSPKPLTCIPGRRLLQHHARAMFSYTFIAPVNSPIPVQTSSSFTPHCPASSQQRCPHLRSRRRSVTCTVTKNTSETPPSVNANGPPAPLSLRDSINLWIENILVFYGDRPPRDSAPIAKGTASDITSGVPFFSILHQYFLQTGPIYKLAFGPKVFIVVQDPVIVRSILRENSILYDKGILAELLEEVMGKGLIPADYETWKVRRRAITPAFHIKWLSHLTSLFAKRTLCLCDKLYRMQGQVIDMETEFNSLALDIIGITVFNYHFDSITAESPVIKAVLRILKETEVRSLSPIPYWKIPGAKAVVPRLRAFYSDMDLINQTLNDLIRAAKLNATPLDLEDLQDRDYGKVSDPSLLRFLVELRGEETTNKQLRDDLMTLLIAGHETVASLMTWMTVELAKNPAIMQRLREEIDQVIGDEIPTYGDIQAMPSLRMVIAETLRLYPAPPILIRRLLADTDLPQGSHSSPTSLMRGTDIFINVYSLHRSPDLWENPDKFDPDRWLKPFKNPGMADWGGYSPASGLSTGSVLYPNEIHSDFAFIPFGGGSRKCVGDIFSVLEASVALSMLIRRFDFELADSSQEVPMTTGATIHTKNGLMVRMKQRSSKLSTVS